MQGLNKNFLKHTYTMLQPNNDKVYYGVMINNNKVYEGVSYVIPNTTTAIIDVTDIIKSNINLNSLVESSSFPNNETPYQITSSTIKYRIITRESLDDLWIDRFMGDYIHYDYGSEYYDYDYSYNRFLQRKDNYDIIDGANIHIDYIATGSTVASPTTSFSLYDDLNTQRLYFPINIPSHYHLNAPISGYRTTAKYIEARKESDTSGVRYNIVNSCNYDGQLYWTNNIGGMETLPIKTSTIKNQINKKTYSNINKLYSDIYYTKKNHNWESRVYEVNSKISYTLVTPLLFENDMYWLEELFLSPYVYYYDRKLKKFYSVIITNNEFEFKKLNQDNKKIYYEINIELSKEIQINS